MPLSSEYDNYCDWETEAKRRAMMLYNRPISMGVDYFVNNSDGRKTAKIDVEAGGVLKHKVSAMN